MPHIPDADPSKPTIRALPPTTVRQIGSSQVLVDPSSVVKELIDNALDARATAIFVDITANTVDLIQVKDNGHGIPAEDRALVCRRYCTSKIRDLQDLRNLGGKWLGFRGEAMASMAEMSGSLGITTRVEGEAVAVLLSFKRNGDIDLIKRASHPVGTTVKVTDFFKFLPVRKQAALKHSAKQLAKIRRLMQAYALARPTVRFSLKVLRAKSNRGDFMYAPKATANVVDAAYKVIGKDCAGQCDWVVMDSDGFVVHAFLPKSDANAAKMAYEGAFLSIDARPVSTYRGTPKKVVTTFMKLLRKSNTAFATVKEPFMCMNIICPPDSYDPNIEPAKDDVLFEDEQLVVSVVEKLLSTYYPEALADVVEADVERQLPVPRSRGRSCARSSSVASVKWPMGRVADNASPVPQPTPFEVLEYNVPKPLPGQFQNDTAKSVPESSAEQRNPQWRYNMYGIDEEDMDLVFESALPVLEDEEEMGKAVAASNPWTIARLNALIKPKKTTNEGQLMTPPKGPGDVVLISSSPTRQHAPRIEPTPETLTPQTITRSNVTRSATDMSLQRSIQHFPSPQRPEHDAVSLQEALDEEVTVDQACLHLTAPPSMIDRPESSPTHHRRRPSANPGGSSYISTSPPDSQESPIDTIFDRSPSLRRGGRRHKAFSNKSFRPPKRINDRSGWIGSSTIAASRQKKPRNQNRELPFFETNEASSARKLRVLNAAERLVDGKIYSENNTDIRNFFGTDRLPQRRNLSYQPGPGPSPAFMPGNARSNIARLQMTMNRSRGDSSDPSDMTARFRAYEGCESYSSQSVSRSPSIEPHPRSRKFNFNSNQGENAEPDGIEEQLRKSSNCETSGSSNSSPSRPASTALHRRSKNIQDHLLINDGGGNSSELPDFETQLRAYVNNEASIQQRSESPPQKAALDDKTSSNTLMNSTDEHRSKSKKLEKKRRTSTVPHLRSKSTKLPLERVPYLYQIQNVTLPLFIPNTALTFTSHMSKLNMGTGGNGLEWRYPAPTADNDWTESVFGEGLREEMIATWCRLLGTWYETKDGGNSVCLMMQGVWAALSNRQENGDGMNGAVVEIVDSDVEMESVAVSPNAEGEEVEDMYGDFELDDDEEMLMMG